MSSLAEIRTALAETVTSFGWRVHPYAEENMEVPAVVVTLKAGRVLANRRGVHEIDIELVAVTSQSTVRTGLAALDDLVADVYASLPNGPLGDLGDTTVFVNEFAMDRDVQIAGNDANAAVFTVTVTTEGLN